VKISDQGNVMTQIQENLVIYQAKNGAIELRGDAEKETIWATQKQLSEIFEVTTQNITMHLKSIYKEKELNEKSTCKKSLQVRNEGEREVKRMVMEYNLDAIIAVGYRINSIIGTKFRIWATKTLKQHITEGYTVNKSRIGMNYEKFLQAVEEVKALLPKGDHVGAKDVLELVKTFASTWFSLDSYDKDQLPDKGFTTKSLQIESKQLSEAIMELKKSLIQKQEATELFAEEKLKGNLKGIFGNIFQSAFGQDVYPTLEEKAAHLLYFIIKNHPFNDGNKRTGAFSFVWFLSRAGISFRSKITPEALTTLTILIAESDPKDKDKMVGLVLLLLKK
jgi:death-on-curing family protein